MANTSVLSDEANSWEMWRNTIDVDSHEMAPAHMWGPIFGPASGELSEIVSPPLSTITGINCLVRPGLLDDELINQTSVWNAKGPAAPGAFDFDRRLAVLDAMGTQRQLIFPTAALIAFFILCSGGDYGYRDFFGLRSSPETDELLIRVVEEYNDWALVTTESSAQRLRPVALVVPGTVESLVSGAKRLVERGARAIWIPTTPLAGRSPADPELDPFWSIVESAQVTVVIHLGTEGAYRASGTWLKAPVFALEQMDSLEIQLEPFSMVTLHHAPEAFLTCMVLGGVFERHPNLRFGAIETGAGWFGPFADRLDLWSDRIFKKRVSRFISGRPSEYLARNVRVTPFFLEPIDEYFRLYPRLADCYCYSTDYPHKEGGMKIKEESFKRLAPLGHGTLRKYFIENGEWLVPS